MKKIVIIVAGGTGTRMKGKIPKQFIEINEKPMIIYSFEEFYRYDQTIQFILSLHKEYFSKWKKIIKKYPRYCGLSVVAGGETRFHSVQNALKIIEEESLVAVHDAVRPMVSRDTISKCFITARASGCAIPCVEIRESVREITSKGSQPADRDKLRIIQTPQVFRSDILQKAYEQRYRNSFTDDATVVENAGYRITLVEGNTENIKITTTEDLILVKALMNNKKV